MYYKCAGFYAETMGRPGLPPGIYFRRLLIGDFAGLSAERGIARAADSFGVAGFSGPRPCRRAAGPFDHLANPSSDCARTHRAVFTWVLQGPGGAGLIKGKTIGLDATTLEANAAMRSVVRRDTGESYEEFLLLVMPAPSIWGS